ncbi:methylase [Mycobacterium marseillense]|uniref:class I SAM-dependent methyltransferase n=1 Tax=Mycobacterium marseillense TaxID=701042 RepID=UPI0008021346|nr:class I SAM-dependent methyltransferase [Mycobacterium marseillense]MCA2264607.1 class I SAM-dependent methyltransferase [Mycobacterium marseillense]OBJ73241.1 methylase [Mycobacterium marseillense]
MSNAPSFHGPDDGSYVLGHVDREVRRLLLQGRLYDDYTTYVFEQAGLQPGMRVLDIGCGPGDVSFIASRLVGPMGRVLGVDASAAVIEFARARAVEHGSDNVRFEPIAIDDIALDEPVDAVIGRMILMYLPDPVESLRRLAAMVRPGGVVAFCEMNSTVAGSLPDLPLWRALVDAVAQAFRSAGCDTTFGIKLDAAFRRAGLGAPRVRLGGVGGDADVAIQLAETWRSMLPVAERAGLVSEELADLDTLAQRLLDQAAAAEAVTITPTLIGAWARV